MTTSETTVCVVDDDPLVRSTIERVLQASGYGVLPLSSGAELLAALDNSAPGPAAIGCILLDVKMPQMDGLQVLREIVARRLGCRVIMISGQGDISTAVEAMREGALDFVEKPFPPDVLVKAVERAIATKSAAADRPSELANLSSRELEVLELLVAGDANKIVAYKLGISQRTVEVHRARIMERLEVATFADLIRKAISAGL